ncbi:MAG: DUF1361 domain-containing protein [bacterium]|nr:DUF1361 domain-containing protein [bacterium]
MEMSNVQTWRRWLPVLSFSSLSLGMLFCRMVYLQNGRFGFLAWNLTLAWAQLGLAYLLIIIINRRGWLNWQTVGVAILWSSFLPNGFYLVTDLVHLNVSLPATLLFDSVLIISFALSGLILGCMSLFMVQARLRRQFGAAMAWRITLLILLLSGFAMYLGRYLGWNSWDLFANPFYILFDLASRFGNASEIAETLRTTSLFFAFNTVVYVAYYYALTGNEAD